MDSAEHRGPHALLALRSVCQAQSWLGELVAKTVEADATGTFLHLRDGEVSVKPLVWGAKGACQAAPSSFVCVCVCLSGSAAQRHIRCASPCQYAGGWRRPDAFGEGKKQPQFSKLAQLYLRDLYLFQHLSRSCHPALYFECNFPSDYSCRFVQTRRRRRPTWQPKGRALASKGRWCQRDWA